ncbi:neuroligin-1-like [Homarus americanus]|uniref:neuroligin-1-like n=1 Tax=Homarus americanus TaxID=6706 RepID=UPI001C458E37|nr:neuroligin-1-like [Homarus americanus]
MVLILKGACLKVALKGASSGGGQSQGCQFSRVPEGCQPQGCQSQFSAKCQFSGCHSCLKVPVVKGASSQFSRVPAQRVPVLSPQGSQRVAVLKGASSQGCQFSREPVLKGASSQGCQFSRVPVLKGANSQTCCRQVPEYYYAFGPTVDGVVIDTDFDTDRQSYINRLASYDLIFGVTPSDAFFTFNDDDVKFGFETDKRNKILRTFIRNTYNYHLTEIMATVINEYTDWVRPVRHPISTRDETLALLSDALYTAPVMHTGNLHALASSKTYLYLFDHQTRGADYEPQRLGCVHGEELPYMWGAPLVETLAHFPTNYTQQEVKLAEAMLTYWTNFARTGNPNEPIDQHHDRGLEKNRFRALEWPLYDGMHRKYIEIDTKPRVKDHYRSHQLSFWLQLVPQLHRAGKDAPDDHHHLENHNDWNSYRGFVRSEPVTRVILPPETTTEATTTRQYNVSAVLQSTPASAEGSNGTGLHSHASLSDGFAAYSTALSVTIAIGCSLLILNVLIFAGVYYQRDKSRMEAKKVAENGGLLAPAHSISGDVHTPPTPSLSVKAEVAARMGSAGMKAPPPTPMTQTTHLPPPEFADYPSQTAHYGTAHGVSHLHTLPRGTMAKVVACESQNQQGGGSLTLSVPRAPPPPQVPCHGSEAQPLLKQTSFTLTSPHTSTSSSKSPTKDSNVGELRV